MGTHLRVLSESYPMNTNITGFRFISKNLKANSDITGLSMREETYTQLNVTVNLLAYLEPDLKQDFELC